MSALTRNTFREVRLQELLKEIRVPVKVEKDQIYQEIGIRSHGKGIFHKEPIQGKLLGNKRVFWVRENTLVFNIVFAWERAVAVVKETEKGMIASHRFPTYKVNSELVDIYYLYRFFTIGYGHYLLKLNSPGAAGRNKTLSQSSLLKEKISLPSLSEQRAIATFLDRKTSQIDQIIEKKERLIKLLEEKRSALITQAVTRGLDPDIPMKDSGIEWIGEIPEHWKICRLKNIASVYGRIGYRGYTVKDIVDEGEGAITLSPSNMIDGKMNYQKCTYLSWDKYFESPEIQIENDDIIFVKTGSTYGKVSLVDGLKFEATINPQIVVLKKIKVLNYYLYAFLLSSSSKVNVEKSVVGGTIPTISQEKILSYYVPLPPLSEQRAIATFLDEKTSQIDQIIEKSKTQIEKLKEYRQALITAAVTGKIDLIEKQSEIDTPDEVQQLSLFDLPSIQKGDT